MRNRSIVAEIVQRTYSRAFTLRVPIVAGAVKMAPDVGEVSDTEGG